MARYRSYGGCTKAGSKASSTWRDGLQEWQQIYQIGKRGAFLVHEPYSGWTERMRAKVADLLWQSVQAQWKRAVSREDGEHAALQLLLDFWQEHIMNEDAFRSLVELLGKQGRFQQAEDCYKQLCTALHQQGRIPSQRTQGTMDFIRTFQFQRERRDSRLVLASSTPQVIEGRVSHIDEKLHPQVLPETRHLIGREMWLSAVRRMVQTFPAKKLIVLRGPIGVGKSSELARLARSFQQEIEDLAIQAYTRWLDEGNMEMQEAGNVVTELAVLLLTRHRLLEVAELVVRCGWISFQLGHGPRLALLAQEVMGKIDWHKTVEDECAGLVLLEALFPFRGRAVETKEIINYERIYNAFLADTLVLQEATEGYIVHLFTLNLINALHFSEAKALLDMYRLHLEARSVKPENSEAWLQKRALLLGMWCEYLQETGDRDQSQTMRKETIRLYQQRAHLLSPKQSRSLLDKMLRIRALGSCFSFLGYHLNRIGEHQEALRIIEQAVALQEQGLANIGVLASSYSDKAQILMELGRFQEAVFFDEKAIVEIQRCIDAGDAGSQGDLGTYYVNRGRLYLRLGRVEEAEHLFRKAFPHIHEDRRKYRMFAQEGLNEIEQWREQSVTPEYQLDWRWVERYRELCAYDNIWWLTWAGPFTLEEQQEWDRLFTLPLNDEIKEQLGTLTNQQKKSSGLAHLLLALLLTLYHSHKHFALCTLSLRHYCSYDVYSDNLMLMKQLLGERKGYSLSCSTSMHDCWT